MTLAPVAVTCGEPAGVGPEIAVKAWNALERTVPMVWIGDPRHLPSGTPVEEVQTCADALRATGFPVLPHRFAADVSPGKPDLKLSQDVIDVIARAVTLAQNNDACAVCTGPIHKKVLQDGAGFAYPGHTEYLAHLGGDADVVMMLASDQLRVVPATIHIALKDVPAALTPEVLRRAVQITHAGLRSQFGIANPRIAVAGLNPHAGEGGAMGHEELDWIAELIRDMAQDGMQITGPHSADTLFHAAARARYDAAVCMYHDQALIPIKTLDFDRGVNVTLGLPFIRTSPDHGTAFDIAGTGTAKPTSMIEAIRMAAHMASAS